ncbi:MAG: MOSC domain-containing protein [Gemmatimonadota bacterium]
MSARVEALWLKSEEFGPMEPVEELGVVARTGIRGNADWGGKRQITVIERERWETMMEALGGADIDPSARRANVMISGCDLADSRHHVLRLGDVRVQIRGETRPCERMDEAFDGLRRVMAAPWNGGAYGVILDDGVIRVGDAVRLEDADPEESA